MSNRTIAEFNHDFAHDLVDAISKRPEETARLFKIALGGGSERDWKPLERYGIKYGTRAHHSSTRKARVENSTGSSGYEVEFP